MAYQAGIIIYLKCFDDDHRPIRPSPAQVHDRTQILLNDGLRNTLHIVDI